MSYQVLARKWRPQTFADVVGQEHVLTALANGLNMGRIHHAYLFSGTRGVGKTSIARLLAKGLNCETGITATPCGKCDNCREIEQGRFVDLIEIDAASRTRVEDTRELLDNVQYAPARGRFKVYLIDEVHMLSRHSFNALLKTLEEPPEHVKFLLATTDPQKLPVTILSRCLQFHLKALDMHQIAKQLEYILGQENIDYESRALQLLARAAEGSLRDALSLTDQAIASGDGLVSTQVVSMMLGTLDDDQAITLIEAIVKADGSQVMALVGNAASRGVEWEALLVEMLGLLHHIAMAQLSPTVSVGDELKDTSRLHELARTVSPADIQLYYQTLLIGRKELPWAPDRRMGVEMTLLRALAFHPQQPLAEPDAPRIVAPVLAAPDCPIQPSEKASFPSSQVAPSPVEPVQVAPISVPVIQNEPPPAARLPDAISQALQARSQLQRQQGDAKTKKSEPAAQQHTARPGANAALERLALVTERAQARQSVPKSQEKPVKKEAYRWKALNPQALEVKEVTTPKALKHALEHEKTPELAAKLAEEAIKRDPWAAQVSRLNVAKLVEQLALNAWKTQDGSTVCLHLRTAQRHLNNAGAQQALAQALGEQSDTPITLTVVEDDSPEQRTPLEWRQAIYEEKLEQARASIIADNNIQTLQRFFEASLDEESIRPV